MVGYIYENNFTLFYLKINRNESFLVYNCYGQFIITADLPMNTLVVLVVATYKKLVKGAFTIIVDGPSNVSMTHRGTCNFQQAI